MLDMKVHTNVWGQQSFFKYINTFIQQGHIKLIKSNSKDTYKMNEWTNFICSMNEQINAVLLKFVHQSILEKVFHKTEDCSMAT